MATFSHIGIARILEKHNIYDAPDDKAGRIMVLKNKVDPRYELFEMRKAQLKEEENKLVGIECEPYIRRIVIEKIWRLRNPARIIDGGEENQNTFVFPKSFRVPSRKELIKQYKKLTGLRKLRRKHRDIEAMTRKVNREVNIKTARFIGNDSSCALYSDCVQQIFSYIDPEIETNMTRIRMIEDAESYGTRDAIVRMRDYMFELIDRGNNPETIEVTKELIDASCYKRKYHLAEVWANKFVRYYNTYYRGNPANDEEVLNDLANKTVLTRTTPMRKSQLGLIKPWLKILNFNKQSSFVDKRNMLNAYRIAKIIPFNRIPRLAVRTYDHTNASYEDTTRLGEWHELFYMKRALYRWYKVDRKTYIPTFDELFPIMNSWASMCNPCGGDIMGTVSRLLAFICIDVKDLLARQGITDMYSIMDHAHTIIINYIDKNIGKQKHPLPYFNRTN